jgi:hypothetical protein
MEVMDVAGAKVAVVVEAARYGLGKMAPDSLEKIDAAGVATSQTESAEVHDVAEVDAE